MRAYYNDITDTIDASGTRQHASVRDTFDTTVKFIVKGTF